MKWKINYNQEVFNHFFITSVDPVKATLLMFGWLAIALPAVGPYPGTTLITPLGNPA